MPRIATLRSGAAIYIYADDHAPPHFHVRGARSNAQIRIEDLQVMRGFILKADLVEAIEFAVGNSDLLDTKWRESNERD